MTIRFVIKTRVSSLYGHVLSKCSSVLYKCKIRYLNSSDALDLDTSPGPTWSDVAEHQFWRPDWILLFKVLCGRVHHGSCITWDPTVGTDWSGYEVLVTLELREDSPFRFSHFPRFSLFLFTRTCDPLLYSSPSPSLSLPLFLCLTWSPCNLLLFSRPNFFQIH